MASQARDNVEVQARTVRDLASDMMLAQDADSEGCGRAIFLIGAGCSSSAGIPLASGVARHCAVSLARTYSQNTFEGDDPDVALKWLIDHQRVVLPADHPRRSEGTNWEGLYSYFFEEHLKAPRRQREIINELINSAGDRLNWAHACLGELVRQRYVHSVLTTNFDQLVLQGIIRTGLIPVIADSLESLNRIDARPQRPQVVHLHGSMHTYNLRNSRSAVTETGQSGDARAMVYGLLQQCDLLVVVGYAGGEEGVMDLLCEAAHTHPQLVIYWVTYEDDPDALSPRCRTLLTGENKFTIWGGPADKFFGDLMLQLSISQPAWVADPLTALQMQAEKLIAPTDDEQANIRILVRAYKDRVDHAAKQENRLQEGGEFKVRGAEESARGDFEAARITLEQLDLSQDTEAARLYALNAAQIYDRDPDGNRDMLDIAMNGFKDLIQRTTAAERLANILSLLDALWDRSEVEPHDAEKSALMEIIEISKHWSQEYDRDAAPTGWALLRLNCAEALQVLGENPSDDEKKPVDVVTLEASRQAFEEAIGTLTEQADPTGDLNDAKAGLAAVLQVLGETTGDVELLRRAVELHREVSDALRSSTQTKESAGPPENLASSLIALAKAVPQEEAILLRQEASRALHRALRLYERDGDQERSSAISKTLSQIDVAAE